MSAVGISCFSPVLKPNLPGSLQGLRQEPFRAPPAKSGITPACLAPGTPGPLAGAEEEPWFVPCDCGPLLAHPVGPVAAGSQQAAAHSTHP